jgi:hypothetical protein
MQVFAYSERDAAQWDLEVPRCPMATFLHTRRFLSYHGNRFNDVSLILRDESETIVGLFPAAIDPHDERTVISHPGITFGGLLHDGALTGANMKQAMEKITRYYAEMELNALRYKAVPYIYSQIPAADDLYALFRLNAVRYRCDLSCAIDLENRRPPGSRRKRSLKKAEKAGVRIADGPQFIPALWPVVEENLNRKLGAGPVHSLEEITELQTLFPQNIRFVVALLDDRVIAGVTLFLSPQVTHAQYIASNAVGYQVGALDAVFSHCIEHAKQSAIRYFDFGTSNTDDGMQLTESLYQFKVEFGGGGVAQEFYEIHLKT